MKKSLIAMIAVAFCVSSAMAQVLVYDYAASFKRIDVKLQKNVKSSVGKVTLDSPKVVSDKLTGYMVIDACQGCDGDMEFSTINNQALVYITRKGDKSKSVYRALGTFDANMFGSKTGVLLKPNQIAGTKVNFDKFSDASGHLYFPMQWLENKDYTGFLGFDNFVANAEGEICANGGFGKVKNQTSSTTVDYGCWSETTTAGCWMVQNLAGSMLADSNYTGVCSEFLFDVCDIETPTFSNVAPVPGTFTLKLNNKLTFLKKDFRCADFSQAEALITDALKTSKLFVPANDQAIVMYPQLIKGEEWK